MFVRCCGPTHAQHFANSSVHLGKVCRTFCLNFEYHWNFRIPPSINPFSSICGNHSIFHRVNGTHSFELFKPPIECTQSESKLTYVPPNVHKTSTNGSRSVTGIPWILPSLGGLRLGGVNRIRLEVVRGNLIFLGKRMSKFWFPLGKMD